MSERDSDRPIGEIATAIERVAEVPEPVAPPAAADHTPIEPIGEIESAIERGRHT
jgi:hypothetical protein